MPTYHKPPSNRSFLASVPLPIPFLNLSLVPTRFLSSRSDNISRILILFFAALSQIPLFRKYTRVSFSKPLESRKLATMIGPNFADDVDCGSFFDHIDDLLDFPTDDVDAGLPASDSAAFPSIWSAQSESMPGTDSVFSGNSASDLSAELSVPYEDIVQLEWLSNFVEDSFSGGSLTINNKQLLPSSSSHHQFQTSSPVSVLESSSSCSGPGRCGRARSKRPRPPTFQPRPAINKLISPSSSVNESESPNPFMVPRAPSDSENYAESRLLIKKKKIKFSAPAAPPAEGCNQGQAVRKCMHCEISKTPQWRAGPMGPKTLCNACGVRHKSGRLFPEYRPAASPTFVPSLHSNSHKKVVEMRTKGVFPSGMMAPDSPELIPNNSNLGLDYM